MSEKLTLEELVGAAECVQYYLIMSKSVLMFPDYKDFKALLLKLDRIIRAIEEEEG